MKKFLMIVFALLLLSACVTSPYPRILFGDGKNTRPMEPFNNSLDLSLGYDRMVIARLQIDNSKGIRGVYERWLNITAMDKETGSAKWVGAVDINTGANLKDGMRDVLIALQGKTDFLYLEYLYYFSFDIVDLGRTTTTRSSNITFPMNWAFKLRSNSINYLGRIKLIITKELSEVKYAFNIDQNEAFMKEDLALFYSLQPQMQLSEELKNTVILAPYTK